MDTDGNEVTDQGDLTLSKESEDWHPWAEKFLDALGDVMNVSHAAKAAGIKRQRAYQYRDEREDFREAWDDAMNGHLDAIERAFAERAIGWDEDSDGPKKKYDTTAGIFLLKGWRREKYGEHVKHKHEGEIPVREVRIQRDEG